MRGVIDKSRVAAEATTGDEGIASGIGDDVHNYAGSLGGGSVYRFGPFEQVNPLARL